MKLTNIKVSNYKALKDISVPLSGFVCIVGENNAGKSSILQALSLFISPSRLEAHHFYDVTKEITIEVTMSDIEEGDLARFTEEQRSRIVPLVKHGGISLTRRFIVNELPEIGYYALKPISDKYSRDKIDSLFKGRKGKAEIRAAILTLFTDKSDEDIPAEVGAVKDAKALIDAWGEALPPDQKSLQFTPLPTGAAFSISPLLPDDIYIPAVKDLKDDVSSKQSSSFGKVLSILMDRISSELAQEAGLFANLKEKLTRIEGTAEDKRMPEIKKIEATIQKYVHESFSNVALELDIPPPELKTVLSTARIFIDDGTKGPLELKGDGLRRAVVFAVLRTYVALVAESRPKTQTTESAVVVAPTPRGYVLLFEEPELFLHPDAQRILFEALRVFSVEHHVIVTTHSPLFLGQGSTSFVRVSKSQPGGAGRPFTIATPVNLTEIAPKDEFQLICFENNNAAFFARTVVLVEGDSEMIVFPHIALTLSSDWSCSKRSVAFVQAKGKGSIQRYRSFFRRFGITPYVIADLDILIEGFEKLEPSEVEKQKRDSLMELLQKYLPKEAVELKAEGVKTAHGSGNLKFLWKQAKAARDAFAADSSKIDDLVQAVNAFFDWETKNDKLELLKNPPHDEIAGALHDLVVSMHKSGVFVLSKGAIEAYYPPGIEGKDKPSKAQNYRNKVITGEEVLKNCPQIKFAPDRPAEPELLLICRKIFR